MVEKTKNHVYLTWYSADQCLDVVVGPDGGRHRGPAYCTVHHKNGQVSLTLGEQRQLLFVQVDEAQAIDSTMGHIARVVSEGNKPSQEQLDHLMAVVARLAQEAADNPDKNIAFGRKFNFPVEHVTPEDVEIQILQAA